MTPLPTRWKAELRMARGTGRLRRWVAGWWLVPVLAAGAVVIVLTSANAALVLAGCLALGLLVEIARSRKRVVIQDVLDHTADASDHKKGRPVATGAATLIAQELARLHRLYEAVDEHRAFATDVGPSRPMNATLSPGTLDDSLQGAVSRESTISFGPLTIPAGFVLTALGRLARGPQLAVALHRTERGRVLTAQLVRPGAPDRFWRVTEEPGGHERRAAARSDARRLGACHLRRPVARREDQLARGRDVPRRRRDLPVGAGEQQGALLKLKEAEHKFMSARAEDEGFGLAYYNLGVVYSEMYASTKVDHYRAAAQAAFRESVTRNPRHWPSYYALASERACGDASARLSAIELCDRIIALKPGLSGRAQAYDLRGLAQKERGETVAAVRSMRKAARSSLRALASAHARAARCEPCAPRDLARPTEQAAACLLRLGDALAERTTAAHGSPHRLVRRLVAWQRRRRAFAMFRLALWLVQHYAGETSSLEAVLHFQFGRAATDLRRDDVAFVQFQRAARLAPGDARYLAHLASASLMADRANAGAMWTMPRASCCSVTCRRITTRSPCSARRTSAPWTPATTRGASMRGACSPASWSSGAVRHARSPTGRIPPRRWRDLEYERALDAISHDESDPWQVGHVAALHGWSIARRDPEVRGPPTRCRRAGCAVSRARDQGAARCRERDVWPRATHAVMLATCRVERPRALTLAEGAVGADPVSSVERQALARVLQHFGDYDGARAAWKEAALLLKPSDAGLKLGLARCYADIANDATCAADRRKALIRCSKAADAALKLSNNGEAFRMTEARYLSGTANLELGKLRHRRSSG